MNIDRRTFLKGLAVGVSIPILPINIVSAAIPDVSRVISAQQNNTVRVVGRYYKLIDRFSLDVYWRQMEVGEHGPYEVDMHTVGLYFDGLSMPAYQLCESVTDKVNKLFRQNGFGYVQLTYKQVVEGFVNAAM